MVWPTNLLLLPPVPSPATYANIKAAYHAPISLALDALSVGSSSLDVALPCPHLYDSISLRCSLYAATQEALANLYKLTCVVAAQKRIELAAIDNANVIDVRVVLIAYPRNGAVNDAATMDVPFGPVIDIAALARSRRPWRTVFSVATEQGEQLLRNFQSRCPKTYNIKILRGGIVQVSPSSLTPPGGKRCLSVVIGGTFDHLHIGHKLLLTMEAFALDYRDGGQFVITVGMTAAQLLEKKQYAEVLESWATRTKKTSEFLKAIMCFTPAITESVEEVHKAGPNGHAILVNTRLNDYNVQLRFVEIWDPFGPTITDPEIDTIVVSGETRSGGKMVNDRRIELGMQALEVFEVQVLDAQEEGVREGFEAKLSSTEIRRLQAERRGKSKV